MERLERVNSFQEFVQIFSQFGNEMVEFAYLTGDRQNDLKDEKKKARMAVARAVLEKGTMMLLTASKVRAFVSPTSVSDEKKLSERIRCQSFTVLFPLFFVLC